MSFSTIIFALVFVIPMIFFFLYFIVWKDDPKSRKIGLAVIAALVIFAIIIAYFVNKDK